MDYLHNKLKDNSFQGKFLNSIREVVFGLEDGIVSTLGSLTGIAAATQNTYFIILSGFIILFVESLSMAGGTFLSSKTEQEVRDQQLEGKRHQIETNPESEKKHLASLYKKRGFTEKEIHTILARVCADKDLWLEEMAHKELGLAVEDEKTPFADALFMGFSYIIGGAVPIAPYFFFEPFIGIFVSIGAAIVTLFALGFAKGRLVKVSPIKSGLEMLLISISAAGVGYAVGQIIETFFKV